MASIFKRKGVGAWLIVFFDEQGRRREKSSRTTDRRAAERIAAKIEADVALRRSGVVDVRAERLAAANQQPLQKHVEAYLAHSEHAGQARRHVICKRAHLLGLLKASGCSRLSDLDATAVERHLQALLEKGKAPRTVNLCRSAALAFMGWCERSGLVSDNPLRRVPVQATAGKRRRNRRALTRDELTRLLDTAREQDGKHVKRSERWSSRAAIYGIAVLTGLRRNEMANLRWDDVDFDAGIIRVRAEVAKARRSDVIPLHQDAAVILKAIRSPDAKPLDLVFPTMPTAKTFALDLERAGIPKHDEAGRVVDLHALRTTLGTELARQGVSPQVAQKIMRHSDYRITMEHYVTLGVTESAAAMGRLPGVTEQPASSPDPAGAASNPSTFPSAPQQFPQQLGHDEVPPAAVQCNYEQGSCPEDRRSNSFRDHDLCDLTRLDAVQCDGTPGGTRTPNPQIRSLMLYPIELRARTWKERAADAGESPHPRFVARCRGAARRILLLAS